MGRLFGSCSGVISVSHFLNYPYISKGGKGKVSSIPKIKDFSCLVVEDDCTFVVLLCLMWVCNRGGFAFVALNIAVENIQHATHRH